MTAESFRWLPLPTYTSRGAVYYRNRACIRFRYSVLNSTQFTAYSNPHSIEEVDNTTLYVQEISCVSIRSHLDSLPSIITVSSSFNNWNLIISIHQEVWNWWSHETRLCGLIQLKYLPSTNWTEYNKMARRSANSIHCTHWDNPVHWHPINTFVQWRIVYNNGNVKGAVHQGENNTSSQLCLSAHPPRKRYIELC